MNKRKIYTMQDSQEQSEPARDTRKDFCSNPAEIREKREAAWINGHPKKHYDVKGAEKGIYINFTICLLLNVCLGYFINIRIWLIFNNIFFILFSYDVGNK